MSDNIQQDILRVFEKHQRVAGGIAPETKFLCLLLPDAKNISNVRNSFRGIFRLNRFLDDVQEQLCVCFGVNDGEKDWTLAGLADHIAQKKNNPAAQKTLAEKRLRQARQYLVDGLVKAFLFLSLPMGISVWNVCDSTVMQVIGLGIAGIPVGMVGYMCTVQWRFCRRLLTRLTNA